MKLFTRPRRLFGYQLRPGDQIATTKGGSLINFETTYVDADLVGAVKWSVVHSIEGTGPIVVGTHSKTRVMHTLGEHTMEGGEAVMTREVMEIDPWSYVHRDK